MSDELGENKAKQAFTGLKILKYDSRKARETEKLRIILEVDLDELGCGSKSVGDFLGALESHKSGDTNVGFSLFMEK